MVPARWCGHPSHSPRTSNRAVAAFSSKMRTHPSVACGFNSMSPSRLVQTNGVKPRAPPCVEHVMSITRLFGSRLRRGAGSPLPGWSGLFIGGHPFSAQGSGRTTAVPGRASDQRGGHDIGAAQGGVRAPWEPVSGSVDGDPVRGAADVHKFDGGDHAALRRAASLRLAVLAHHIPPPGIVKSAGGSPGLALRQVTPNRAALGVRRRGSGFHSRSRVTTRSSTAGSVAHPLVRVTSADLPARR